MLLELLRTAARRGASVSSSTGSRRLLHGVGGERRGEHADAAHHARGGRDDHRRGAERGGHAEGVDRAGAAEREQRQAGGVVAALGGVHAGGAGHVLVDEAVDAPGGLLDGQVERLGDVGLDRLRRRVDVERHLAAEEEVGVEVAEHEVGVGDRGLRPAAAVTGRAGVGARGLRAAGEQPERVDVGERPAADADLDHVDRRRLDREAAAAREAVGARGLELVRDQRAAVLDQAQLGRRAAHVERHQVGEAVRAGELRPRQRARGGAGFEHPDRPRGGVLRGGDAAVGEHHAQAIGRAEVASGASRDRRGSVTTRSCT